MALFQQVLDESTLHLDTSVDSQLSTLLKKHQCRVAFAESVTAGAIAQRLSLLPEKDTFLVGGHICSTPTTYIDFCQVPSTLVKEGDSPELAMAMVQGLSKTFKTNINIASTGYMKSLGLQWEALIHIAFYVQGVVKVKTLSLTGTPAVIFESAAQSCMVYLSNYLTQLLENLEEVHDG